MPRVGLVRSVPRVAREGDDVTNVADACGKHDQPLKAEAEATVWHGAILAEVHVSCTVPLLVSSTTPEKHPTDRRRSRLLQNTTWCSGMGPPASTHPLLQTLSPRYPQLATQLGIGSVCREYILPKKHHSEAQQQSLHRSRTQAPGTAKKEEVRSLLSHETIL